MSEEKKLETAMISPTEAIKLVPELINALMVAADWAANIQSLIEKGETVEAAMRAKAMAHGIPMKIKEALMRHSVAEEEIPPEILEQMEVAKAEVQAEAAQNGGEVVTRMIVPGEKKPTLH